LLSDGLRIAALSPLDAMGPSIDVPGLGSNEAVQQVDLASVDDGHQSASTAGSSSGTVWHHGRIETDQTWSADEVHAVDDSVTVASGVRLTIAPGAIVKFAWGTNIAIEDGATLDAPATAEDPIVLTSIYDDTVGGDTNADGMQTLPRPGDWNGFMVWRGGQLNLNAFVDLRYVLLDHAGTLSQDETWLGRRLHHVTADVVVPDGVTLTIEPGAVVKFEKMGGIRVESGGQLIAHGDPALPICFTSIRDDIVGGDTNNDGNTTAPAPGDWRRIDVDGGEAVLDHVEMRYGGGPTYSERPPGMIWARRAATLSVSNSVLKDASLDANRSGGGIIACSFSDVTVQNSLVAGGYQGICAGGGLSEAGSNMFGGRDFHVRVINCTLDDNEIGMLLNGATVEVVNTIVTNNKSTGVEYLRGTLESFRHNNVWVDPRSSSTNYVGMDDPTGTDGNMSVDPEYKDWAARDYHLGYCSPMIDAGDGTAAPENDLMGAPRYDDPRTQNTGTPTASGAYADLGAFEFVETAESTVDLVVSSIAGPSDVMVGETVRVEWTVANLGAGQAVGPWHDRVSLVFGPDNHPTVLPMFDGLVADGLVLGPGQTYTVSAEARVPGGTVGAYHWEVLTNARSELFEGQNQDNNTTTSDWTVDLDLAELPIDGTPLTREFAALGQSQWFKVTPADGQAFHVALDLADDAGASELYVAFGHVPTRQYYDMGSEQWNSADVSLSVSDASAEVYYVLAYARALTDAPTTYTLTANPVDLDVLSVTPDQGGTDGTVTITVIGEAFPEGTEVDLITADATAITPDALHQVDATRILATFSLSKAPAGPADVRVTAPNGASQKLAGAFEILPGGSPDYWVDVEGPSDARWGREYPITLSWGNRGTVDGAMLVMKLDTPPGTELALTPGGPPVEGELALLTAQPDAPGPVMAPGYADSRTIYVTPPRTDEVILSVKASPIDAASLANYSLDWDAWETAARPDGFTDEEWSPFWDQLKSQLGSDTAEMVQELADNAVALSQTSDVPLLEAQGGGVRLFESLLVEIGQAQSALAGSQTGPPIPQQVHCLFVGSGDYQHYYSGGVDLRAATKDAKSWASFYHEYAEVPRTNMTLVLDAPGRNDGDPLGPGSVPNVPHAGARLMLANLKRIGTEAGPNDMIVFHYSGHGLGDGLVLPTTSSATQGQYVVGWETIHDQLKDTEAKKIVVVLDACYSNAFADRLRTWIKLPHHAPSGFDPDKWVVITASSAEAYETWDGQGLLTWHLKEQLNAGIKDGQTDLYHAFSQFGTLSNGVKRQTPDFAGDESFSLYHQHTAGTVKHTVPQSGYDFGVAVSDFLTTTIHGSRDPNEKATLGIGEAGYITDDQPITYTIYFENDPEQGATAPVQELLITDQLNDALDWSTFELGAIRLGDNEVGVPEGRYTFSSVANVPNDANPVTIEAWIDPDSGVVTWHLRSLDTATQDLPEDPLAGFLPVNDETGRGEGYVSFTVLPKAGLPTGTEIQNQATITFDPTYGVNPPITTGTVLNTIDAAAPTSAVNALPESMDQDSFDVVWSGSDSDSGLASYDIYVSTDGGDYVLWQEDTTETQATFSAEDGHTYSFYSTATDQVGHTEAAPASADATTRVDVPQSPPTVTSVEVAGGLEQRSVVRTLQIGFGKDVNIEPSDVTLLSLGVDADTPVTIGAANFQYDEGAYVCTLSFTKALADGCYELRIDGKGVTDSIGQQLDGNGDDTPGDDYVYHFHCLAGDLNGDMAVNVLDAGHLQTAMNDVYDPEADVNGDGKLDSDDTKALMKGVGLFIVPPKNGQKASKSICLTAAANGVSEWAIGQPAGWASGATVFRNERIDVKRPVSVRSIAEDLEWVGLEDAVRHLEEQDRASATSEELAVRPASGLLDDEAGPVVDLAEQRPASAGDELGMSPSLLAEGLLAGSSPALGNWAAALLPVGPDAVLDGLAEAAVDSDDLLRAGLLVD